MSSTSCVHYASEAGEFSKQTIYDCLPPGRLTRYRLLSKIDSYTYLPLKNRYHSKLNHHKNSDHNNKTHVLKCFTTKLYNQITHDVSDQQLYHITLTSKNIQNKNTSLLTPDCKILLAVNLPSSVAGWNLTNGRAAFLFKPSLFLVCSGYSVGGRIGNNGGLGVIVYRLLDSMTVIGTYLIIGWE